MWPFTPFGGESSNTQQATADEVPEGAIIRPLYLLGDLLMGGSSGQDPNAERHPLF